MKVRRSGTPRDTSGLRDALAALALLVAILPPGLDRLPAQTESRQRRYFYAIEALADGSVVRRGDFVIGAGDEPGRIPAGSLTVDSIVLAPRTRYRFWLLEADTLSAGFEDFETPAAGRRWFVRDIRLGSGSAFDFDEDRLHGDAEFILGTNPRVRDSDGDGIDDGAEIAQGLNPLDGRAVRTGIIATADTPGTAVDIDAFDDIAVVADSQEGISVFNVFNGMDPVIIAQVRTPGAAVRVACVSRYIAVAAGSAGLVIIDIADPPAARVLHQIPHLRVAAVVAAADIAFVGTEFGRLALVDLATGSILREVPLGFPPADMRLDGDHLYILDRNVLRAVRIDGGRLQLGDPVSSPFDETPNTRLFVGGGVAHAVHGRGYNTFSLEDPDRPRLIAIGETPQFGWQQIVLNGSGTGLAVVGQISVLDSTRNVSVYDTSDPGVTNAFLGEFVTPGFARAVSIYNGLGYVADHDRGLQVVNYLAHDALGIPPQITLSSNFSTGTAEEGTLMRLTATVSDDVQVRNVEFHIDGIKAATDGNFPFEHRFITPLAAERPSFTIRARASDTGGNATWTDETIIRLVEDATPPRVLRVFPAGGSLQAEVTTVAAFFDELIDPATITAASFELRRDGGDVIGGAREFRDSVLGAFLLPAQPLAPGTYRATVGAPTADRPGNPMATPETWSFTVYDSSQDSDRDCLPDAVELQLGLDPDAADSDQNGTPDGEEDPDGDGLTSCDEVRRGLDPRASDSDGDGIPDATELSLGLNAGSVDSDSDGFTDAEEIELATDPLDARSLPIDPAAMYRYAVSGAVSLLGTTYPSSGPVREAAGPEVSLFSATYPPGEPVREAAGPVASVENQGGN